MKKTRMPEAMTVDEILQTLERLGTKRTLEGFARYAIKTDKAFGVSMVEIHKLARKVGRNHQLAIALWKTGWYEARMLTAFVAEPALVTVAQMNRWCREFDNWAICDTLCFKLFDRTPHAWSQVWSWADAREEFVKRAAFALLASLGQPDKKAHNQQFIETLSLVEQAATDERNFVKKGVSWALRVMGRRNVELNYRVLKLARTLSVSNDATARWIGKDTLRDLASPAALKQLQKNSERSTAS